MVQDQKHKSLLQFIRRIIDVAAAHSKEDLVAFRSAAAREFPSVVPIIDAYLHFSEGADTEVLPMGQNTRRQKDASSSSPHLFDMLRDKRAFPANSDLSEFAGRIVPDMTRKRFDKMSRGEIVAKIIEYVETLDERTRRELEASMRDAMVGKTRPVDRKTFLSKWEKIIKGIQL